jgi:hypothetical protein
VLHHLQIDGFTVNPTKCDWAVKETDFLGFWFTPSGPNPWRKKIDAILTISSPSHRTEVHAFCGAVTFYRDMFHWHSEIIAPITKFASKNIKFLWGAEQQNVIETMKALISEDVLLQ